MNRNEKLTAASAEYLRRLRFKGAKLGTLRSYETVLRKFSAFLAEQDDDIDLYDAVETWRDSMLEAGRKASTVKQNMTVLNGFFEAVTKRSFPEALRFPENPVDTDLIPVVKKKPYELLLDDADIIKLWSNDPPTPQTVHTWPRNYAIVCTILGTGIRNEELRSLTLADVDFRHKEITVRAGKGDKFRIVDAPEIVLEALAAYLDSGLRPAYLSDNDLLFGSTAAHEYGKIASSEGAERWHKMTGGGLSQLIERHVQNVVGDKSLKIRSHDLRHLFARIYLNTTGNVSELQAALGHSNPNTTQIYSGMIAPRRGRDSAKEVIEAANRVVDQLRREREKRQKIVAFPA